MPSPASISTPIVLALDRITLRLDGAPVFKNTSWTIREGERWAVTGPNGSGKTVLMDAICGRYPVISGKINHPFLQERAKLRPDMAAGSFPAIAQVSFSTTGILRRHGDMYYQQRFYATETQGMIPVRELLGEHADSRLNEYAESLGIAALLDRFASQLSNGETKKLLILRAVLKDPFLLILDQPLSGLDPLSAKMVSELIDRLASRGIHVIIVSAGQELPAGITHVLEIQDMEVRSASRKENMSYSGSRDFQFSMKRDYLDRILHAFKGGLFREAVRMEQVRVAYGEKLILQGIDWMVSKGERWALTGANGAGKSTLLSLIFADHPQAYANEIWIFDKKRGSGESIWDIKKRIGYMSPELHAFIPGHVRCSEICSSGISVSRRDQEHILAVCMELLGIPGLQNRRFDGLSTGQQRLVLLVMALSSGPDLLILDEPCQGLDGMHRAMVKGLLDALAGHTSLTMIYVSHEPEDFPDCIGPVLTLSEGLAQRSFRIPVDSFA